MSNLHITTALTEFTPLSPEEEQSTVGLFFSKVFNFKTNPTDGNSKNIECKNETITNNVSPCIKHYQHLFNLNFKVKLKSMVKNTFISSYYIS